jgi:hypothetical protein
LKNNILHKCFNKIKQKIKQRWHLEFFQFFVSFGKAKKALKHLQAIPISNKDMEYSPFQNSESRIWQRYSDKNGNLLTFTWKRSFFCLLKTFLQVSLICILILGFYQRREISRKVVLSYDKSKTIIRELKHKLNMININQLRKFQVIDGSYITVDLSINPIIKNEYLYIPTKNNEIGKDSTIFFPLKKFRGFSIIFSDSINLNSFIDANDNTIYSIISPLFSLQDGLISQEMFRCLRHFVEEKISFSGAERQIIMLKIISSVKLQEKPNIDSKILDEIIVGEKVKLEHIGPIINDFIWMYISYMDTLENVSEGWIAAYPINEQFIEIIKR